MGRTDIEKVQVIRLLLVDDHTVLRAGLRSLLNAEDDMEVIGEAESGQQAVDMAHAMQPDVVLMDVTMPGMSGVEATCRIKEADPEIHILALTMHDDASYLRDILGAGGAGYVLKEAAGDELLSAIRAVYQGGTFLHPSHTKALLEDIVDRNKDVGEPADEKQARYESLSEREAQVFKLVALGYRNSEIAEMLHLSVKTVETYKARLMQKLGLRSRAALVRYALELGILEDEVA
ncbi:MAG: Oxygen regulatory protein NreC [Anaerolineales bacterium]|nr:Oxygen regulatory protein NreC [Anaerolineales bacterium]